MSHQGLPSAAALKELTATLVRVSHLPGGIIYVRELANPPATIRPGLRNRHPPMMTDTDASYANGVPLSSQSLRARSATI